MAILISIAIISFIVYLIIDVIPSNRWISHNSYSRTCKTCGRTYSVFQDQWGDGYSVLTWEEVMCEHLDKDCDCQKLAGESVDWVSYAISRFS